MLESIGWALLSLGILGVAVVFLGYPLLVRLVAPASRRDRVAPDASTAPPSVTVIVAMRNAALLLPDKIASLAGLEDPGAGLEVLFSSDGSTDDSVAIARKACDGQPGWHVLEEKEHRGKHAALDAAAARAGGDYLVFTDVDAVLEPAAIVRLIAPFADPRVGGVCGQRLIGEAAAFQSESQASYVALDSGLKGLESRAGSITSNDGKLYAIRAELYEPIPGGVTDDLFANMSVVRQGFRFVFEGQARAWIKTPSRSRAHELGRRRRIVCRSLRGIWLQRAVLSPWKTGLYAFGLGVNKVGRRLLPFFLLMIYAGSALAASSSPLGLAIWLALSAGALVAWVGPSALDATGLRGRSKSVEKVIELGHYALVGFAGTFLGVIDFLMARQVVRWDPVKSDR